MPEALSFSASREIFRIFAFTLPSLALLGYLLRRVKTFREWGLTKPKGDDFLSFLITLPLLFLSGWALSFFASHILSLPPPPRMEAPRGLLQWFTVILSCAGTGYLEEGYFRFYLFKTLETAGIGTGGLVFLSVLLFTFCHGYEGPWGMANAALAGFFLALVFKRRGSLHGIAWAHGAYNILVFSLGA